MTENGDAALVDVYTVSAFDADTFAADSASGTVITDWFDDANGGLPYLTRNDWMGTFPTHDGQVGTEISTWGNEINGTDVNGNPVPFMYVKTASAQLLAQMNSHDSGSPVDPASLTGTPVYSAKNGLSLIQLRGLAYDDPLWDDLLDQLASEDYNTIITSSG